MSFDFQTNLYSYPIVDQPHHMTNILQEAFNMFFPSKKVIIRQNAPAWTNTHTRLLLRQKI